MWLRCPSCSAACAYVAVLRQVIDVDRSNWDTRRMSVRSDQKNRGELTIEQEEELKKKIADTSWMIDKDKQQIQQTQDKVAAYEYEFKKIQVRGHAMLTCPAGWPHKLTRRMRPESRGLTSW